MKFPRALPFALLSFGLALSLDAQALDRLEPCRAEETERLLTIVFEGIVVDPDGAPAEGAVIVSSAGGQTVTDRSGSYRLEVSVPADVTSLRITAVGGVSGGLVASTSVDLASGSPHARVAPLELASGSACPPSWLPTFGGEPGLASAVRALAVFDDGSGPALHVAGDFRAAGGVPADRIAKWNGSGWVPLGSGLGEKVYSLAVFDDGGGPALYAGGFFTTAGGVPANKIAKWDGSSWAPLGSGLSGLLVIVFALTVFDDGSGPALYAGGSFSGAGGVAASKIAKWDGSSWSALGSGLNSDVHALAVLDDGSGPALHVGGLFTTAGGMAANYVARWDGASWAPLGSGMDAPVDSLAVFDDGSGLALWAGGSFTMAGGVAASRVARWDGASWAAVGTLPGTSSLVNAFAVFDDGSGPALHAAAGLTLARWDGTSWTAVGGGMNNAIHALTTFDDGGGPALWAGGSFTTAGSAVANRIAKWDGASWSALGSGINKDVDALTVFDDGSGPALYVGGEFDGVGGLATRGIARWDGSSWSALGSGITAGVWWVTALAVFDDGSGPALYAGGSFTGAGGVAANHIAKWDGSSWSALGSGTSNDVLALAVFDDGGGPALYAGGSFTTAGGVAASRIARWDGSSWSNLGSGMNSTVQALAVFDDGSGPALYAGGNFTTAGGAAANRVAKWNGSSWTALGAGSSSTVYALAVFDDGSGSALYVAGVSPIAKWDGSSRTPLASGPSNVVYSLAVFDDGGGPALYAGGGFSSAGGVAASDIAKWDGSSWTSLGSGMNFTVRTLAVFNDRTGPALHAGGDFTIALDSGDSYLAKWGCPDTNPPTITCPPLVKVFDRGAPGEIVTFTVTATDEEDPTPSLVCVPPSGSFISSLMAFDDGGGLALYAGGVFTSAGGVAANGIAKWNGSNWAALGNGLSGPVESLWVFNDRTGPALFAGGDFRAPSFDGFVAKWGCPDTNPPTIVCPASIVVDDRSGNGRGEILSFTVTASDAEDPTPSLVCSPPSGSLFLRGTTTVTCTATDFSGNQATCQFTVTVRAKVREP